MKTFATLVAASLAAASAHGSIVSTSGPAQHITPPPSLMTGALTSRTRMFAIDEQQGVQFTGLVDRLSPAVNVNFTASNAQTAFLSTWVDSHIIHFDDTGTSGPNQNVVARVTFSDPIMALIYTNTRLDQSDAQLGNAGTFYPFGVNNRGFTVAYTGLDTVRLINPFTVEVTLGAAIDQIRVLTVGVPSPGAMAALPLAGFAANRRRR